jgi:hypothetical protein
VHLSELSQWCCVLLIDESGKSLRVTRTILNALWLESSYSSVADPSLKLVGAGAITFHSTRDIMFVGDRSGALLAWDIRVQPILVGR